MKHPEQGLQRSVLAQIQTRGGPNTFVFHPANGGLRSPVEAAILTGLGLVKGIPDLGIIQDGRAYWLELKSERGKLSPAQAECHARLRAAGCEVATVSTIDAALAQLEAWGIRLRGSAHVG